jgi:hypothetical protein
MEVSQGAVTEFTSRVVTVGTRAYNPVLSPTVLNQVRSHRHHGSHGVDGLGASGELNG